MGDNRIPCNPYPVFAGKLVGRYYDSQGNPTKYLKGVESKAKRGAQLLEKQKIEEAKIPSCNSKWSEQDGGELLYFINMVDPWSPISWSGVKLAIKISEETGDIALTGKISQRCACFKEEELGRPGLEVYKGCDYLSKSCRV
ncbi:Cytochrome b5-like Heme/Steroid binding domain [Musa troglodytarum]|uniref:Cytochrome b5-like Heme/Steroid binding domain n=1 Tax=Musa troglodytarum TaxID=320322 RepID=A0A9E7G724_9LILI|nr:Cytochrome b5-like Heme/Steroid binding domain [Musa troglodytarum]